MAGRRTAAKLRGNTNASLLAAHGRRAFCEYMPVRRDPGRDRARSIARLPHGLLLDIFLLDMRCYRGPNGDRDTQLGPIPRSSARRRSTWLKRELVRSNATWKVIAADLPLSVVGYGAAVAQAAMARRVGRELEIADLLAFIKHAGIRNTVWITADMHYTARALLRPERAHVFQDFEPFWEFISGPLHAGTWRPQRSRQHVRAAGAIFQNGCSDDAGAMNLAPVLRAAVLRPCGDRWRHRGR